MKIVSVEDTKVTMLNLQQKTDPWCIWAFMVASTVLDNPYTNIFTGHVGMCNMLIHFLWTACEP